MSAMNKPIVGIEDYARKIKFARELQIKYYYGEGSPLPDADYDFLEKRLVEYEVANGLSGPGTLKDSVAPSWEEAEEYFSGGDLP